MKNMISQKDKREMIALRTMVGIKAGRYSL
jgi:hypothetical protein